VIGNLEVTLAGPPFKGYPQFSSPDELAHALKAAGFHVLVMANNHALDRGRAGMERTIEQLDRLGILHTGTFTDPGARSVRYPLVVQKNGIRLALLNYTYGTNGLQVPPPLVVNRIDTLQMREDLQKAATAEPDFILVAMHWGNEYERTENGTQRELAAFLFRNGADAIIGSHPHVVQPIRGNGKGELVAYSMGNFISNQRDRYRDGGIAVQLDLVKTPEGSAIEGHAYLPFWVWKPATKKGTQFTLVPAHSHPGQFTDPPMSEQDRSLMMQFLLDTRENLEGNAEVQPGWLQSGSE
jgi:poly-gamma-glutamate synthesis protein (capsule biosynthesis protein)